MLRHQIMKLPTKEDTRKQLDSVEDEIKKIQQDITSHQHTFQVGGCRGVGGWVDVRVQNGAVGSDGNSGCGGSGMQRMQTQPCRHLAGCGALC